MPFGRGGGLRVPLRLLFTLAGKRGKHRKHHADGKQKQKYNRLPRLQILGVFADVAADNAAEYEHGQPRNDGNYNPYRPFKFVKPHHN